MADTKVKKPSKKSTKTSKTAETKKQSVEEVVKKGGLKIKTIHTTEDK